MALIMNARLGCYRVVEALLCQPEIDVNEKDKDGVTQTDDTEQANILNDFFASVFKSEDTSEIPDPPIKHLGEGRVQGTPAPPARPARPAPPP